MRIKYRDLENERKTMPPQKATKRLTTSDMHPIIEQEKLFFELTKTIMNDKDLRSLDFTLMSSSTKKSFDFMKKLLYK
jgi:hypothetical protein